MRNFIKDKNRREFMNEGNGSSNYMLKQLLSLKRKKTKHRNKLSNAKLTKLNAERCTVAWMQAIHIYMNFGTKPASGLWKNYATSCEFSISRWMYGSSNQRQMNLPNKSQKNWFNEVLPMTSAHKGARCLSKSTKSLA